MYVLGRIVGCLARARARARLLARRLTSRAGRFSNETVTRLRSKVGHVGELVFKSMRRDPLYPVFQYGVYRQSSSDAASALVHLEPWNFMEGIEARLKQLLRQVRRCIRAHGAERVLQQLGNQGS